MTSSGALYTHPSFVSKNITMRRNMYSYNSAASGGAVFWESGVPLAIYNEIYMYNSASYGGAISVQNSPASISGSTFASNRSEKECDDVILNSDSANTNGGAIFVSKSVTYVSITNSKLNSNRWSFRDPNLFLYF